MTRHPTVTKALIPSAGFGTRFLPATKAIPKELLPIVDKPSIQYIVEEAVASGIHDIIIITGRGKSPIEDHFDVSFELENYLERKGKRELAAELHRISHMAHLIAVRQKDPRGLGHAVLCAEKVVGENPFGVLLPDDLIDQPVPCMKQMTELFEQHGGAIVAVTRVPRENVHLYGIVDAEEVGDRLFRIHGLVEKPDAAEAPSTLAVIGRYILPPEIFSILKKTSPGAGGEIQLTDALIELAKTQPVYGFEFPGDRYDAGDKLGHLIANIVYALKDPELGTPLKTFLAHLKLDE